MARIPVGLQLYSVRSECAKDLAGTVAAVARMGYKGVEFAGYYNKSAADLRKLLDENGLKCCGTHTGFDTLMGDNLAKTIEFNKTLGNKFLIVPGMQAKTRQDWLDKAKAFTELVDKVKPQGMYVGYHNHAQEFKPLEGGELPWDLFFGNTPKDVVMQFDIGNAMGSGGKAVDYLKKYPGRALTIHLKPWSKSNPKAVIGEDELPWKEIFDLCETTGNTEWYIVEYEVPGLPPLEAVEKCLAGLKKMGKA
ncbi:MAG: sugar phosphate isomerase/epimerase [Planctomycetes bacterium]|nr:sugar phosphate isomerase/epimerase [Planctomycetota bacterium]